MIILMVSACASTGERVAQIPQPENDEISIQMEKDFRSVGSIYGSPTNISLYEDSKARRVGDIVTILLVEETNAKKSASTSTTKDNSLDVANPTI